MRQHHSFIKLPDPGYSPREYDIRSPSLFITFADYASPLEQSLQKRWIVRHRLNKKNPRAAVSDPIEPIVYYVDAGAPKQIQEALIEGASWWTEAFETAGFKNAFQVKVLPPDAALVGAEENSVQQREHAVNRRKHHVCFLGGLGYVRRTVVAIVLLHRGRVASPVVREQYRASLYVVGEEVTDGIG